MKPLIVNSLLATFLPRTCLLCGLEAGRRCICRGCRRDLPWIRAACRRCGAPLPTDCGGNACAVCRVSLAGVDRIRTALAYEFPTAQLVTRMKFQSRAEHAFALGELLGIYMRAAHYSADLVVPDLLVPVPLHHSRLAKRGFNQAEEIARPLGQQLQRPLLIRGCTRVVDTVEQMSLSGGGRRRNIRGAFRVSADLTDASVAVVDDVLTTGSTAMELAAELRKAGAGTVQVWAVTRSLRRRSH